MPDPIERSVATMDLSRRFLETHTVTGSPAAAAETTIATLTIPDDVAVVSGIQLRGWCAFTVGTNGTAATLKLHHTDAAGATLASTGALTVTAANLVSFTVQGVDALAVLPGQIYLMTLQVTSGSAVSTVSAASLFATIV